jgi:hypothetical protein
VKCRSVRGIPGDKVAREVLFDSGRDILLVGAAFLLILLAGGVWPVVGGFGRWVLALAAVVFSVQFLTSCLINLADSVLDGIKGPDVEGSLWLALAMLIRLAELALVFWMTFFLFRRFS